jgi:nucleoside 2-deoxyribosyltransferase
MKVYLAASFSRKNDLREFAKELRAAGHTVTSRWLRELSDPKADMDVEKSYKTYATHDIEDIEAADTFVIFTVDPTEFIKRGGKHFEAGYAYARRKSLFVVGPDENIFYQLPEWKHYGSWDEFFGAEGRSGEGKV